MTQPQGSKGSFWSSIPGVITAVTGLLGAISGLILALNQIGIFGRSAEGAEADSTEVVTSDPPAAGEGSTWVPGVYMQQAVTGVLASASSANLLGDYRLVEDQASMAGAYIEVGDSATMHVQMEAGVDYAFLGVGDDDVIDLDLRVVGPDGQVVAEDVDSNPRPVLELTPESSGIYDVRLQLYDGARGSYVALAMLSTKAASTLPLTRLQQAVDRYRSYGEVVHSSAGNASYITTGDRWAVFGVVLNEGGDMTINTLTFGRATYAVLAAGDEAAEDIDLELFDSNDVQVGSDTESDATPMVLYNAPSAGRYSAKVRNHESSGPSFVIMSVLEVRP